MCIAGRPKCELAPCVVFIPQCGIVGSAGPCRTRSGPAVRRPEDGASRGVRFPPLRRWQRPGSADTALHAADVAIPGEPRPFLRGPPARCLQRPLRGDPLGWLPTCYWPGASPACTPSVGFALDRKILTAATGDQAGSNHSLPVPPSTYKGLVPRSGSRDGCPVGSSRHRAPVQGIASIASPPRLSSDTFTREGA